MPANPLRRRAVHLHRDRRDDQHNEHREHVDDHKLDALAEIIDEQQGQPLIVFYNYRHEYERMSKRFPQVMGLNVNAWNDGKIEVMALHPASEIEGEIAAMLFGKMEVRMVDHGQHS